MDQPVYWIALVSVAVLAAAARLAAGKPFLRHRAVSLGRGELAVASVSTLALVWHCAVMFFAPWTDALPGGEALGEPIRALDAASQWAYWIPSATLVLALRRVWWPGIAVLVVTLTGVGITMFWPHALTTHLAWLAAAALTVLAIATSLIGGPSGDRRRRDAAASAVRP